MGLFKFMQGSQFLGLCCERNHIHKLKNRREKKREGIQKKKLNYVKVI